MTSERRREYMNEHYEQRKEYFRLRYLNQKVSKLLKMDLPAEAIQKLIKETYLRYRMKTIMKISREQEEKEAEAKRRYDFIYN